MKGKHLNKSVCRCEEGSVVVLLARVLTPAVLTRARMTVSGF